MAGILEIKAEVLTPGLLRMGDPTAPPGGSSVGDLS